MTARSVFMRRRSICATADMNGQGGVQKFAVADVGGQNGGIAVGGRVHVRSAAL